MNKIIIIGAGACGVYSALLIKQAHPNVDVLVLEAHKTPLKKLLATGNGRCNLSNKDLAITHYDSDNLALVKDIIDDFDMPKQMQKLGLYTKYMGQLLYPYSEQAKSVYRILIDRAQEAGVVFLYEQFVKSIRYQDGYIIETEHQRFHSDGVIVSVGSSAGKLSQVYDRRSLFTHLSFDYQDNSPSLTQMYTKEVYKTLKGVRMKGVFSLYQGKQLLKQEKGEMLFTNYGVSGIAIMQLSRYYREGVTLVCDLLPDLSKEELANFLQRDLIHPLEGLVPYQLSDLLEKTHQDPISFLKQMTFHVKGIRESEYAQVEKGGLLLSNFNNDLESKDYPHFYAGGEILNVNGDCGGYNLHFAFASGYRIFKGLERFRKESKC